MNEAEALHWTVYGIGAVAVFQGAEFLLMHRRLQKVWPMSGAAVLEILRIAAGLLSPFATFPCLVVIAACHLASMVRFRGTFNGGSDAMFLHLLIGVFIAVFTNVTNGLAYIAVVLLYSYLSSGLRKLRRREWRDGSALAEFLSSPHYRPTALTEFLKRHSFAVGWGVMLFEIGFICSLWRPYEFIAAGVLFHAGNSYAFGLNRFFWSWMCAYPALLYIAERT